MNNKSPDNRLIALYFNVRLFMNAYDFDETVYYGDSEFHFIEYIFAKYPSMKKYARRYRFYRFLQKKLKLISRDAARVKIFSFLKVLDNVDKELEEFWATHEKNLKKWYLDVKLSDDVIVSATPGFILEPIAGKLGVKLIATRMDKKTGELSGTYNYGEEKVRRFKEIYGDVRPEKFYSDSYTDEPMAKLAGEAFIVSGDEITPWEFKSNR